MVNTKKLFLSLKKETKFFVGVPDSVLKNFFYYLEKDKDKKLINKISANEGTAVSLGIGYYLSTKKLPCIYLQNSGLGNAINPLISISHKKVYSIPLILLIGWRGSPNSSDEPQHIAKGKITKTLLKILGINFLIIDSDKDIKKIHSIVELAKKNKSPVAILVKKNSLSDVNITNKVNKKHVFKRSDFIKCLLWNLKNSDKIISTTGYTSRELYQIRKNNSKFKGKDFYMVGGMGHTLSVAQGMALSSKNRIICLDGDGSLIMHLGSMHTSGYLNSKNLKHILLNNTCHESVGGQTTHSKNIDFKKLSLSVGYKNYYLLSSKKNIEKKIKEFLLSSGPSFLEVKISKGKINPLGRPKNLINIKKNFIK